MNPVSLLLVGGVGIAGALGAVTRYLIGRAIAERAGSQFPLGTLLINASGSFVIGLLFALAGRRALSPAWQTVLATGFLGGYTTFSTMSWEGCNSRAEAARGAARFIWGAISRSD